ncbi:Hypothetical protein MSYG_3884 [Malassezia sympodialis ATCC 42132]|uniref:Uncharacterized protein n=1 Tax=Malassezia sympodialis (strain ATCC 42132) TaxID=1230383 RepID=A0A1M8AAK8_MALS4|nr:Hypothetical protein MSYG_3884 [Malassezia sympodialis ATCC 42132]
MPSPMDLPRHMHNTLFQHMFASNPILETGEVQYLNLYPSSDPSWSKAGNGSTEVLEPNELSPLEQLCSGIPPLWPHARSKFLDVNLTQGSLRTPNTHETKVSTVQHVCSLGRQHGSIHLKTECVSDTQGDLPETSLPSRSETPLCTKIARKCLSSTKKPRRKPAPHIGDLSTAHAVHISEDASVPSHMAEDTPVDLNNHRQGVLLGPVARSDPSSLPPARPQKNALRIYGQKAPATALWYLSRGMTPVTPPPRPRKSSQRLDPSPAPTNAPLPAPAIHLPYRQMDLPELDPDSDSESIPSSIGEPVS